MGCQGNVQWPAQPGAAPVGAAALLPPQKRHWCCSSQPGRRAETPFFCFLQNQNTADSTPATGRRSGRRHRKNPSCPQPSAPGPRQATAHSSHHASKPGREIQPWKQHSRVTGATTHQKFKMGKTAIGWHRQFLSVRILEFQCWKFSRGSLTTAKHWVWSWRARKKCECQSCAV